MWPSPQWDRGQSNLAFYEGEGLVYRVVRVTNNRRCGFHIVRFHTYVYAIVASAWVDL